MKSNYYVKSNLPFSSMRNYSEVILNTKETEDSYVAIFDFWKKVLGVNYLIDINFSGFDFSELFYVNGVYSFMNSSKNLRDFFLRFNYLCNNYCNAVKLLNDYIDKDGVSMNYSSCFEHKEFVDSCDIYFNEYILKSPYIHINLDVFDEQDLYLVCDMNKNQVLDLIKEKNPLCKNYYLYVDNDTVKSINLNFLSPDVKSKLSDLSDEEIDEFVDWVKNGKHPFNDEAGDVEVEPFVVSDEDFNEFLENEE